MLNQAIKAKLGVIAALALAQSACSLSNSSSSHIVISLPQQGFSASVARVLPSPSPSPTSGGSNFPVPTSLSDFQCIGVMVSGEGIAPLPGMAQSCQVDPTVLPKGLGMIAGLVPASGGSIDITVPSGPDRLIQLIGVQSSQDCPDIVQALSSMTPENSDGPQFEYLGDPYLIGQVEQDLFADQTIEIQASFDPTTAKPMFNCGDNGGGGNNSGPITLSNLDLYPHSPSSDSMLRVVGNTNGGFNQAMLYSDPNCTLPLSGGNWMGGPGGFFMVTGSTNSTSMSGIYLQAFNSSGSSGCTQVPGSFQYLASAPSITINQPMAGTLITGGMTSITVSGSCTPYVATGVINFFDGPSTTPLTSCTCMGGTSNTFSCSVPVSSIADGPFVLRAVISDTSAATPYPTSDDAIFMNKDSLAPDLAISTPADGTSVTGATIGSQSFSGTCSASASGYSVNIGFNNGSGFQTLGSATCSSGSWSGTVNLSGVPAQNQNQYINVQLAGPNGPSHTAYTGVNLNIGSHPIVTSISPTSGPIGGGTTLTINGMGFTGSDAVMVGGYTCSAVSFVNNTQLTCVTSAIGTAGPYGVQVTDSGVPSNTNVMFTYQ